MASGHSDIAPAASPAPLGQRHVERLTQEIGAELLGRVRAQRARVFSARYWTDRLLGWSMRDPAFKTQLFRYIDAFPALRTSARCSR